MLLEVSLKPFHLLLVTVLPSLLLLRTEVQQLHLEQQSSSGWDLALSTVPVGVVGPALKHCLLASPHAEEALVPALDHLSAAHRELEGLAPVAGGVEDGAVLESPVVVGLDLVTALRGLPLPLEEHSLEQASIP